MTEEEFFTQSMAYLNKEMDAETSEQFYNTLADLEPERLEIFERLQQTNESMKELVPMASSLNMEIETPWDEHWETFASRHGIGQEDPTEGIAKLETVIRRWKVAAWAAILVAILSLLTLGIRQTQPSSKSLRLSQAPLRLSLWNPGTGGTTGLAVGSQLKAGIKLWVGTGGSAILAYNDGALVAMEQETSIILQQEEWGEVLRVENGELFLKGTPDRETRIRTGVGTVVIHGEGQVRLVYGKVQKSLWLGLIGGDASLVHSAGTAKITTEHRLEIRGDSNFLQIQTMPLREEEILTIRQKF